MANASAAPRWLRLQLPAAHNALPVLQSLLQTQARACGIGQSERLLQACEEALATIIALSQDTANDAEYSLEATISIEMGMLMLQLQDNGLPYDPSLLPDYNPANPEAASEDATGLAAFLMQKLSDYCEISNLGQQGHSVILGWLLHEPSPNEPSSHRAQPKAAAPAISIQAMLPEQAIHLARLMYRSYGYSYVNPDMYLAERIQERLQDGRLSSWVAIDKNCGSGALAGHIALMKASAADPVVEVGAAVIAPEYRGQGILELLLQAANQALSERSEQAACVHAVCAHPFTQKTFGRLDYLPTALQLAYTPTSLNFRNIQNPAAQQRGSIFYSCKLLQKIPPITVYLGEALRPFIEPAAQAIGLPLVWARAKAARAPRQSSKLQIDVIESLNIANITLQEIGSDLADALYKNLRRLCRQRRDAIYLYLNLGADSAPWASEQALELGFIAAGLAPFSPWPASLCLQYLNNQEISAAGICAVSDHAQDLLARVYAQYSAAERL